MFTDFIFVDICIEGFRLCPVCLHRSYLLRAVSGAQNSDSVLPPAGTTRSLSWSQELKGMFQQRLSAVSYWPCHWNLPCERELCRVGWKNKIQGKVPSTTMLTVEAVNEFLTMKLGIKIIHILGQGFSSALNGTNSKERIKEMSANMMCRQ